MPRSPVANPPLSEVNTTMVWSVSPTCSSFASTWPTAVSALDHRSVHWQVLSTADLAVGSRNPRVRQVGQSAAFGFVLVQELLAALQGYVHRIGSIMNGKTARAGALNKVGNFLAQPLWQVLTGGAVADAGIGIRREELQLPPKGPPCDQPATLTSKPWYSGQCRSPPRCHLPACIVA